MNRAAEQLTAYGVGLPDGNGLDFVVELRDQLPNLGIIVASGHAVKADDKMCVIQKPYFEADLASAIKALFGRRVVAIEWASHLPVTQPQSQLALGRATKTIHSMETNTGGSGSTVERYGGVS